jgi:hypothetical protein
MTVVHASILGHRVAVCADPDHDGMQIQTARNDSVSKKRNGG